MTSGNVPPRDFTELKAQLRKDQLIGNEIQFVELTRSTMDDVTAKAREGASEGFVLVAERQTAGRGRHRRSWESTAGKDLLFSVLFRPRPALAGEVNMLLALSIAEVVEKQCGVETTLKWPNDVRLQGAKVAGVLLESAQGPDGLAVVAGIGINVNSKMRGLDPGGTPAVSMSDVSGKQFDRAKVLKELLGRIDSYYADVRAGGTVVPEWRSRLATLGQHVNVTFTSGDSTTSSISGTAEDVDEVGRLLVRDNNGRMWPVAAGEVTLHSPVA